MEILFSVKGSRSSNLTFGNYLKVKIEFKKEGQWRRTNIVHYADLRPQ
ncbi:MAG: hypothetical protein QW778_05405 [Candidatus Micrarchaeaceae archaeon]